MQSIKHHASLLNTQGVDDIYQDPDTDNARFRLHCGDPADNSGLTRVIQEVQRGEVHNLVSQMGLDTETYKR